MRSDAMQAFTLVELSIVLVILGLLTGGILTGQSLIRAAELRSVVTEYQRYQTAAQTFRDKYRAVPGDMKNARAFWGDGSTATGCQAAAGEPAHHETCNGNGDGTISYGSWSLLGPQFEFTQFWRQLALAGLIEGNYSGYATTMTATMMTWAALQKGTVNVEYYNEVTPSTPTSKMMDLRWYTGYNPKMIVPSSTGAITFEYNYGHFLVHGRSVAGGGSGFPSFASTLKPEEVWNIDSKMDDGKPGLGKVLAYPVACTTVASITQGSTAEYLLTSTTGQCGAIFTNVY